MAPTVSYRTSRQQRVWASNSRSRKNFPWSYLLKILFFTCGKIFSHVYFSCEKRSWIMKFTNHAKERMSTRSIASKKIEAAITFGAKVEVTREGSQAYGYTLSRKCCKRNEETAIAQASWFSVSFRTLGWSSVIEYLGGQLILHCDTRYHNYGLRRAGKKSARSHVNGYLLKYGIAEQNRVWITEEAFLPLPKNWTGLWN